MNSPAQDPRNSTDFVAECFPTANGLAEFKSADPRNEALVVEFRHAYHEINRRYQQLQVVRSEMTGPDFARRERAALQAIETALRVRDELEDRCAPIGVIAEPVTRDGLIRDLRFTFGSTDASGRYRSEPIVSSALLNFRVPPHRAGQDLRPPNSRSYPCDS